MRNIGPIWALIGKRDRRRLVIGATLSGLLAVLDMVGVTTMFPLVLLMMTPDGEELPGPLSTLADVTGIQSGRTLAGVLMAAILVLFIVRAIGQIVIVRSILKVTMRVEATIAERLLRTYLSAPLLYHVRTNTAAIQRTIGESLRIVFRDAVANLVPAVGDAAVIGLISAVVFVIAPVETIVGGLSLGLVVVVYQRTAGKKTRYASKKASDEYQESLQYIQQSLGAVREIQLRGAVEQFTSDLLRVRLRMADHERRMAIARFVPRYLIEMGMIVSTSIVGVVAFARHPADKAVAILAIFVAAVVRVVPSLNRVMVAMTSLTVAQPNVRLIEQAFQQKRDPEGRTEQDTEPLGPAERVDLVEARQLTFRYPGASEATIDGFDLKIERGDYIGIVGPSGSGKTTLLNLILGLLDPTGGHILVNDLDLIVRRRTWQDRIGYVPQDVAFLDASIAENVALGVAVDEIDRDRVLHCIATSQLSELVDALPEGIDSPVREAGKGLSGGQRQRIGLARALYHDPEVLVLDEATSALDTDTEKALLDALDAIQDGLTVIVVAHRQTTVARCRRVVELSPNGSYRELTDTSVG